jgi:hypothetical protein
MMAAATMYGATKAIAMTVPRVVPHAVGGVGGPISK